MRFFKKYIIAIIATLITTTIFYFLGKLLGWNLDYINGWFSATVYIAVVEVLGEKE